MNKTFDLEIEVLSPVHIGSGKKHTSNIDYIYDDGKVYYIDINKLENFFKGQKNIDDLLDDYVEIVGLYAEANLKDGYNLKDFFDKYNLIPKDYSYQIMDVDSEIREEINTVTKTAGRPYIPGSSLKGAIRTAIIYNICLENNIKLDKNLEANIFSTYSNDILKNLQVTDTNYLDSSILGLYRNSIYNLEKRKDSAPAVFEALKPGTKFKFRINIKSLMEDKEINKYHSYLREENIEEILSMVNRFSLDLIKNELGRLKNCKDRNLNNIINKYGELLNSIDYKNSNEAIMRIGQGKSFYSTTMALLMNDSEIGKYGRTKDPNNFPVSRHFIVNNKEYSDILGWIKMRCI